MKLFIGYDHGDAETLISYINPNYLSENATTHANAMPDDFKMPTRNISGVPAASVFAVAKDGSVIIGNDVLSADTSVLSNVYFSFKKRPTSFFQGKSQADLEKLAQAFSDDSNAWPSISLAQEPGLLNMRDAFVKYINSLFLDNKVKQQIVQFRNCDEVVIVVGHPTKWNKLDIDIYKRIFKQSILGKDTYEVDQKRFKLSLVMAAESRAAFLYARQAYMRKGEGAWDPNKFALLMDIGSSTIDITALSGKSINGAYNDGHPNLGAQWIDHQIYQYFIGKLKKLGKYDDYVTLCKYNPYMENTFLYAARLAKEEFFSTRASRIKIESYIPMIPAVILSREEMEQIIHSPIKELNGRSWAMSFDAFLDEQKKKLLANNIVVERIVLTGSAAQMPFVKEVCKKHFPRIDITVDLQPAQAIAKGLALVGQSNEKSLAFQKQMDAFLKYRVKQIVAEKIPSLSTKLSRIIAVILLYDITMNELLLWKADKRPHRTIQDAMNEIKRKCDSDILQSRLKDYKAYNDTIKSWLNDEVVKTIQTELIEICRSFNIAGFNRYDVKTSPNVPAIGTPRTPFVKLAGSLLFPVDLFNGILSVVGGILTAAISLFVVPFIAGLLVGLLSLVAASLAAEILALLLAVPPLGFAIFAAILGIAVGAWIRDEIDNYRERLIEGIMNFNLPMIVRKMVTNGMIRNSIAKGEKEAIENIEKSLNSDEMIEQLSNGIARSLQEPLQEILDDIKYEIEAGVSEQ